MARPQRGQPGPEEKESDKWINGIDASRAVLYQAAGEQSVPRLIHVMDREGDAYEVMMTVADAGDSAIIRCAQNRKIDDPLAKAHEGVRSQPVLCRAVVEVSRKAGVPERRAAVEVRSMRVTLVPDLQKYPHAWPTTWNLVEVWEPAPPAGTQAAHWLLWTLEPAATADEALEVVRKYTCRWPIEEVHLVLKSGCKVEDLRLETWDRLEKAVRVDAAVAARIVLLRDLAGRPRGPGAGGPERRRGRGAGMSLWERDEAIGTDDRPGGAVDRPSGRALESQTRWDAWREDIVAWAS